MGEPPREPRWHDEPRSNSKSKSKHNREHSADRGNKRRNDRDYYGSGRESGNADRERGRDRDRHRHKDAYDREYYSYEGDRSIRERQQSREGRGYRTSAESSMSRRRDSDYDECRRTNTSELVATAAGTSGADSKTSAWDDRRDEWNCIECQTWNDIRFISCDRCGFPQPRGRTETRGRKTSTAVEEVDEFGRAKDAAPAGPRWPPPFDRRNATYVFDSRSGMFYHASSQFFFDPKTKLYYGNQEKKYYVFSRGEKPPFREFKQERTGIEEASQARKMGGKKVIAISLKTKVFASSDKGKEDGERRKEETQARIAQVSKTQKLRDANIDRWSERGREMCGREQVVRTGTGSPVCLLCKRKFVNLQKLDQHETLSKMHKTNLSQYSRRRHINEETAAAHYRDRAFERRILHGTDDLPVVTLARAEDAPATVVDPQHALDQNNVGNQMLQKLGWKSGTNLGRNAGVESTGGALKNDWERIEQLAKSSNRK